MHHDTLQVDANIQSDDLRQRVQQLEIKLCGSSMELSHSPASTELGRAGRRGASPHCRSHTGLAVLDRLDQLDREVEGVTHVTNKAKVCLCCLPSFQLMALALLLFYGQVRYPLVKVVCHKFWSSALKDATAHNPPQVPHKQTWKCCKHFAMAFCKIQGEVKPATAVLLKER